MKTREREVKEGDRFGMLVVIDVTDEGAVRCRCGCGVRKRFDRPSDVLRAKSCGCVRRAVPADEGLSPRQKKHNYRQLAKRGRPSYPLTVAKLIQNAPRTITGRQLAAATGMTEGNVSAIRNGRTRAFAAQVHDRKDAKAISVVIPFAMAWLDRQRLLGLISPEGAAAVERLIEDLR